MPAVGSRKGCYTKGKYRWHTASASARPIPVLHIGTRDEMVVVQVVLICGRRESIRAPCPRPKRKLAMYVCMYVGVVKTVGKRQDEGCCRTSRYAATLLHYSIEPDVRLSATQRRLV